MRGNYKDLIVWQKSIQLVKQVYELLQDFPQSEIYALASQIKRAVVSISSNIAEGNERSSEKDFLYFIQITLWSCVEVETELLIAKELGFVKNNHLYKNICDDVSEIRKMLGGLKKSLL